MTFVPEPDYRNKSVVVTGAGGFVGSHLCSRLLEMGAKVRAVLRPGKPYPRLQGLSVERDDTPLSKLELQGASVLFHLAGVTRAPQAELYQATNVQATFDVLQAAKRHGVECVVLAGTLAEYGVQEVPFQESQPSSPINPYAASKAAATCWAQALGVKEGLRCFVLRFPILYGPGQGTQSGMLIPNLLEAIRKNTPLPMTKGEQTRDFLWVGDAVEALLCAGLNRELGSGVFNYCSERETSLRELLSILERLSGCETIVHLGALPYRDTEQMRYVGDSSLWKQHFGVRPLVALEEGLGRLLSYEGLSDESRS